MKDARQTFEAIARANGGTDFSLKQDGRYAVQNIQSRWTYFRLGWEAATKREQSAQQQEPVAWANPGDLQNFDMKVRTNGGPLHTVPLYTSPQPTKPWVGLTDEDKHHVWVTSMNLDQAIEKTEAKLREKNA